MEYQITTQTIDPQPIVSIRERHPMSEIPTFLGRGFGVLFGQLGRLGIPPAGPPFVIYHAFGPETFDAEVCVPTQRVLDGTADGVTSRELPAVTVARTLHVGPYEGLATAYEALTDWIATHGTEATGPVRERYLNGPGDGAAPADYRTEIEMPVIAERIVVHA
jgi:effector-binding domain-containing protein